MQELDKLIKALKDAKEVIEKDDELKGKVEAIMRQKMHERWGADAGKKIADHYRDIDETIPAKQRSNIKAGLKTQEEKVKKPKLQVVKALELAENLIKALQELNKDEVNEIKRAPVNGQSGWSQDATTGAFHHKLHGVVSTFKAPDGGFSVRHNGKDLGSFASIGEAGSKIKEHMGWLGSLKQGAAAYPSVNGKILKDDGFVDDDGNPGITKSNYGPKGAGLYNPTDNIKRKMGNTGDVAGEGPNQNVKSYSSKPGQLSAKAQAALEAARAKNKNKEQPVKTYSKEEIAAMYPEHSVKKSTEWSEDELAGKLSRLIPFNTKAQLQPTDQQLEQAMVQSGIAVTPEQAEKMQKGYDATFNNWFAEALKPISSRFASEEEELAYWASIKVADKPDNGPGY